MPTRGRTGHSESAAKLLIGHEAAHPILREDTKTWWADGLGCDPDEIEKWEELATADVEGLRCFLEGEVMDWFENRKKERANRPLIREQAFGDATDTTGSGTLRPAP